MIYITSYVQNGFLKQQWHSCQEAAVASGQFYRDGLKHTTEVQVRRVNTLGGLLAMAALWQIELAQNPKGYPFGELQRRLNTINSAMQYFKANA